MITKMNKATFADTFIMTDSEEATKDPNEQFIRKPEDLAFRKVRRELYRNLREQNEVVNGKRKKKGQSDPLDDFMGGGLDDAPPPPVSKGSRSVAASLKAVKSSYQKLSTLSAENVDQVISSIHANKLTRFMQEVADNLMRAPIEGKDIIAFVHVCSILHQEYLDFAELIEQKVINEISTTASPKRKLILLKVYSDCLIVHIFQNPTPFCHIMKQMIMNDTGSGDFKNDSIIWRLCIHSGADLFGVNRGETTVIDPVFSIKEAVATSLKVDIAGYYKKLAGMREEIATEGKKAREEANVLLVKTGRFNTRPDEKANKLREQYNQLTEMQSRYAFLMKREVEDYWVVEEEIVNLIDSNENSHAVPARLVKFIEPINDIVKNTEDNFYKNLPDVDIPPKEPLSLDIAGIRAALHDRCTNVETCDNLSRHYIVIDQPELRQQLIGAVSSVSKNKINQAPYFARFVSSVSQKFPEIGQEVIKKLESSFIGFINAVGKSQANVAPSPKLHIARYIAELAKFKIGIDEYFHCLSFSLNHFRGKTIDMACTLIYISGNFLYNCGQLTRIQMKNAIDTLKNLKNNLVFQPHVALLVDQAIQIFEPPKVDYKPEPPMNKYQSYLYNVFENISTSKNFNGKAKRVIEKMWAESEKTQVDQQFVINMILDLTNFSLQDMKNMAEFVTEFSKFYPDFGLAISDILCERIRRGIERDNISYRQKQIFEIRFFAELVLTQHLSINLAVSMINLILNLNQPNPSSFLIKISGRSLKINSTQADFFKVKLICSLLTTLIPIIKQIYPNQKDDMFMYFRFIFQHLQLFCLIRAPIPPTTAFDMSDLFDACDLEHVPSALRYDTIEEIRQAIGNRKFSPNSPFAYSQISSSQPPKRVVSNYENSSSDEESEDEFDEIGEAKFLKDLNDLKEQFAQEKKAQSATTRKINIPIDLMRGDPNSTTSLPKMTCLAPPPEFTIITHRNNKNETITIRTVETQDSNIEQNQEPQ